MRRITATAALLAMLTAGCGQPWATARAALTAADAAIGAVPDDLVPDDHREDWTAAREATGAALELGALACDVCEREATRDAPTGWTKWLSDALSAAARLVTILKAAGVPVPPAVQGALLALGLLFGGG